MPNWRNPAFEWDDGNCDHLIGRHGVYPDEAEQVFYNGPHVERRGKFYYAYGRDSDGRYLILVCILRGTRLRVISARDMDKTERQIYERHT